MFGFILILNLTIIPYISSQNVYASDVSLTWDAPIMNVDGSPLTDLKGYKVYYGTESNNYSENIDVGNVTNYTVSNLSDGTTYYFAVTAYDTSGNESDYSNEVSKTIIPEKPADISVIPTSHYFGSVNVGNTSVTQIFTITNKGITDLLVSSIEVIGVNSDMFSVATGGTNACPSLMPIITAGANCTIIATFLPTSGGTKSATLKISSNDLDTPNFDIPLEGIGLCINTYYKDADGDNYGNPAISQVACSPPFGYVIDKTDCNDNDNTIYPGAQEQCDNKDNDCNGQIDEGACISIYIEPNGICGGNSPCYSSIQEGIIAAGIGASIKVAQGTYYENIFIEMSKEFTLEGGWDNTFQTMSNNPTLTVIDGDTIGDDIGDGSVITVSAGSDIIVVAGIENFTITNGDALPGGGIYIYSDSGNVQLTLLNNIIILNTGTYGGGISVEALNAGTVALILTNNIVANNTGTNGGGIYANSTGTGSDVDLTLTNDTITANTSDYGGGLDLVSSGSGITTVTAKNEIIWGNTASVKGDDIYLYQDSSTTTVSTTYSDIGTVVNDPINPGTYMGDTNNISGDPIFVNTVMCDYHLDPLSPCIDAGTNVGAPTVDYEGDTRPLDGDGETVAITDIGADEYVDIFMTEPVADIKANGSDGLITITTSNILSITIELSDGSYAGENADFWLIVNTPFGLYHYDAIVGTWLPGLVVAYQGPLFDLSPYEVLNMSGLPTGNYTFYFGIDMIMNSSIDMDQMYYDSVEVTIQ